MSNTYDFDNVKEKAEEFNNFFSSVSETTYNRSQELLGANSNSTINLNDSNTDPTHHFRPEPVSINLVILTILNTSTKPDLLNLIVYHCDSCRMLFMSLPPT